MSDIVTVVNIIPNLSSGETNQDSEPNLAVNPANPQEIVATAYTQPERQLDEFALILL